MVEGKGLVDYPGQVGVGCTILRHLSPPWFWMQERYVSISTSGGPAGEGRSERRVRLSLDVEIDEIDR